MTRQGAQEDPPARPRRPDDRQLSWKRRAASAVTTSAVIVGLGTLAYGSTHTYLGFISDPPRHESAPGTPTPPQTTPPPSVNLDRPATPSPKHATRETHDAVRPVPSPRATRSRTASPTPEPRPSTPLPTTRKPPPVTFDYETRPTEDGGFDGSVTIRNLSDRPIEQWRLALGFADARVRSVLDALGEPTLDGLVAGGGLLGPPPRIAPGESLTVSFTAEGDASGGVSCRFNDDPCTLH